MPDQTSPQPPPDGSFQQPWDPHTIMRDTAAATRRDRDQALAELRSGTDDQKIRDEFGIDLGEIES